MNTPSILQLKDIIVADAGQQDPKINLPTSVPIRSEHLPARGHQSTLDVSCFCFFASCLISWKTAVGKLKATGVNPSFLQQIPSQIMQDQWPVELK